MDQPLRNKLAFNAVVAMAIATLGLWSIRQGDLGGGLVLLAATAIGLWWTWPSRGPHVSETEAKARMEPGDVLVYWRPGCTYCALLSLRSRLTTWPAGSPRRHRVNIWRDRDAALSVRLLRGGFETVPTVVDARGALIEATPAGIKARRVVAAPQP